MTIWGGFVGGIVFDTALFVNRELACLHYAYPDLAEFGNERANESIRRLAEAKRRPNRLHAGLARAF